MHDVLALWHDCLVSSHEAYCSSCAGASDYCQRVVLMQVCDLVVRMQVWDLAQGGCEDTMAFHTDKVQSLSWNPQEASVLLSGAFGGAVCICDTRGADSAVASWDAGTDIEAVAWGHSSTPTKFVVRLLSLLNTHQCVWWRLVSPGAVGAVPGIGACVGYPFVLFGLPEAIARDS